MLRRQQLEIWTAGLSAATAMGCVVAPLGGVSPRSYLLFTAETAAAISVASLLLGVLLAWFVRRRQAGIKRTMPSPDRKVQQHVDPAGCMRKRREVLDQRLAVDDPRLCSQYTIACTCWSFCADSASRRAVGNSDSSAVPAIDLERIPQAQGKGLPIVQRSGMDNCPFRFAAHIAGSVRADRVKLKSSDTGTAAR